MKKPDERKGAPFLSAVFSFKNEEENLPELIRRMRSALEGERGKGFISGYEMIFVNDASTDRSLDILTAEARDRHDIKVISMSRTFGVAPCVLAGLRYAVGDIVIYMDADLQDPPELIPELIKAWREKGADIVHTVRLSRAGEGRVKLLITRLGYYILKKTADINLIPNAGDFKLLSRRVVDQIVRLNEKKPFMRGLVHWVGFKQEAVYYHRQARFSGNSQFAVLGTKVIRNFLESALISFSDAPLYLVSLTGIVVSLGSFAFLLYIVIQKFLGHNLPGWSAIMVTVLFLGGVQIIALGVIGLYISAIYLETKDRPNYIVESTMGFEGDKKSA